MPRASAILSQPVALAMSSLHSARVGAAGSFFASFTTPGGRRGAVSMKPSCTASRRRVRTKATGPLALRFSSSIERANPRRLASVIASSDSAPKDVAIRWRQSAS